MAATGDEQYCFGAVTQIFSVACFVLIAATLLYDCAADDSKNSSALSKSESAAPRYSDDIKYLTELNPISNLSIGASVLLVRRILIKYFDHTKPFTNRSTEIYSVETN
jgi:hypothetical protein